MKTIILKILSSSALAALVGCLIVFLGLLINMLPNHMNELTTILGSSFAYYVITVLVTFIVLILLSPIYIFLNKIGLINYLSSFIIGAFIVFASYKFSIPIKDLFFIFAGGVSYVLFHYWFSRVKSI